MPLFMAGAYKMKISKHVNLIAAILFSISFFTAGAAQAISLVDSGFVNEISSDYIQLNDQFFRISPTVKVILENGKPGTLGMIKPKDSVKVKVITINKRYLVDTILVMPK
jgi:hypothetical protein